MKASYSVLFSLFFVLKTFACSIPTNVTIQNNAQHYIGINVEGTVYFDIEFGIAGFSPTGNPTLSNLYFENELFANQMPSETTVDFYVRSNCGNNQFSTWIGPYTFYNYCQEYALFYFWDIETFNDEFLPNCWTESNIGTPISGFSVNKISDWEQSELPYNAPNKGAKINIHGINTNDWLICPLSTSLQLVKNVNSSSNYALEIDFDYALTQHNSSDLATLGSDDKIQLVLSSDLGATWHLINEWNNMSNIINTSQHYHINIPAFNYNLMEKTFLIGIWASSGSINDSQNIDFYIDNLNLDVPYTGNVADFLNEKGIAIYPNPTEKTLNIQTISTIESIQIYDIKGTLLATFKSDNNQTEIDLSYLNTGFYTILVLSEDNKFVEVFYKE